MIFAMSFLLFFFFSFLHDMKSNDNKIFGIHCGFLIVTSESSTWSLKCTAERKKTECVKMCSTFFYLFFSMIFLESWNFWWYSTKIFPFFGFWHHQKCQTCEIPVVDLLVSSVSVENWLSSHSASPQCSKVETFSITCLHSLRCCSHTPAQTEEERRT